MRLPAIVEPLASVLLPVDSGGEPPPGLDVWGRPAAVLVLLFPRDHDVRFFLTVRPEHLPRHPGQISLPGGRAEPDDASLWHTALRETREELGIKLGRVRPLGRLEPLPLAVSDYLITPFVAWLPYAPRLHPDPHEVAGVLEVSAHSLLDPAAVQEERWELRGRTWDVTIYRFGESTIWGATARVLSQVARLLQEETIWSEHAPGTIRPVV